MIHDQYVNLSRVTIAGALVLAAAALMVPYTTFAQAQTMQCSDHFEHGSVTIADLTTDIQQAVSGVPLAFEGVIENNNPYPIVDAALYVKVSRHHEGGQFIVDHFLAQDDVVLAANTSQPVIFSWHVPSYVISGDYQVETYLVSSDRFELSDRSDGDRVAFQVSGEMDEGVFFDNNSIQVNDVVYDTSETLDGTEQVSVSAEVLNETDQEVSIPVTWRLYQQDAYREENLIKEEGMMVTVPANDVASVSVEVEDTDYAHYFVEGVVEWNDAKSIVNIEFSRDQKDSPRLHFAATTAYPMTSGEEAKIFACLYNSGTTGDVPNSGLELRLLDRNDRIIHESTYMGTIPTDPVGIVSSFVPTETHSDFRLEASVYQSDRVVDFVVIPYGCQDCGGSSPISTGVASLLLLTAGIVGLSVFLYAIWKRMDHSEPDMQTVS